MTTQNHSNEQHIQQAKSPNSPPQKADKPKKNTNCHNKQTNKNKAKKENHISWFESEIA